MSAKKTQRRDVSPHGLLPARHKADSQQGPVPGRIGLFDAHVGDTGACEAACDLFEARSVSHAQDHGVGASREVSRAALSRRVRDLRGLETPRKVLTDDDVVNEWLGRLRGRSRGVFTVACVEDESSRSSCQVGLVSRSSIWWRISRRISRQARSPGRTASRQASGRFL